MWTKIQMENWASGMDDEEEELEEESGFLDQKFNWVIG